VCIAKSFNAWKNAVNVWCLNKGVNPAGVADPIFVHQQDGNVVLYHNGHAKWSTGTAGKLSTHFVMQNDGNAVLYWGGRALWASHTVGK